MIKSRALRDRYGMLFWLQWILWFAGSFVLASLFWTWLLKKIFFMIKGPSLTITWSVAVFGSWFLFVIPFMRKKERIWKRLNEDQEKAVDAWFSGMGFFVGLLIASTLFWSVKFWDALVKDPAVLDPGWTRAVFGSWLFITIPFLVLMYRKADVIFKNAVERQTYRPAFRSQAVDRQRRLLPAPLVQKLSAWRPALRGGHLVTLVLEDGRRIEHVFLDGQGEILGVYDREKLDFLPAEAVGVEKTDLKRLPAYEESRWLRFDTFEIPAD